MDAVDKAKSGHPGAPMGMADMAEALWRGVLRHNPADPHWANRDRFVLSNGHASMLLYSVLHLTGYDLSMDDIKNFRQLGSRTPGHPEKGVTPGVETTTGPLGQGFATAVGMAVAGKLDRSPVRVYTIIGDGESQEGQIWEAAMLAGSRRLGNLIAFTDYNKMQLDGYIEEVNGLYPLDKKWEAFGWHVQSVDGHDVAAISHAIDNAQKITDRPSMILLDTVKGKGGYFCENQVASHNMNITGEMWQKAVALLDEEDA